MDDQVSSIFCVILFTPLNLLLAGQRDRRFNSKNIFTIREKILPSF